MRAMARNADGDATLIEIKAVDASWPRLGVAASGSALSPQEALAERQGRFGAAVDDALLDRLGLKIGDRSRSARCISRFARRSFPSRTGSAPASASGRVR